MRRLFPEVIGFADRLRATFGDGVRLVYARENGRELGKRSVVDPARVVKCSEMCFDKLVVDDKRDVRRGK